jgi:error-prone DNA polymerase
MDYTALGLTLGRHPLALLRPQLQALGCQDSRELATIKSGRAIRLAGLVLMRQRPGTSKGVVFVTLEDEFGTANLVVWADIGARGRHCWAPG